MHELSVCQALLRHVERVAAQRQARRVVAIAVRIGPLSGVEAELLQKVYPFARKGTVAAEAELIIEPAPVRVSCRVCGAESEASLNRLLCGRCGGNQTVLVSGDECLLVGLEIFADNPLMRNNVDV